MTEQADDDLHDLDIFFTTIHVDDNMFSNYNCKRDMSGFGDRSKFMNLSSLTSTNGTRSLKGTRNHACHRYVITGRAAAGLDYPSFPVLDLTASNAGSSSSIFSR
jgi:hypothetical protein